MKRARSVERARGVAGALFLAGIVSAVPAAARCAPEAWEPARILAEASDEAAALQLFPESASALRRRIVAAHRAGHSAEVRAGVTRLAEIGYALSSQSLDQLAGHFDPQALAAIRARFDAGRARRGSSRPIGSVPAEHRLVEGIAKDAATSRLFASSVVGRELLVHDVNGWHAVPGVEGGSLSGMVIDPRRRRLWIASGALEQTPSPGSAFRGLIAVDLDTLRTVERIAAPETGSPGDVAIGADGTLYASDPIGGAIFRVRPGEPRLTILVPSGRFRSPQGMVESRDRRRVYVADYAYGIGVVDLATGSVTRLAAREPAMLDGIDGLLADGDSLIGIQNGASPRRIVRLRLSRGCEVSRIEILEQANPEWGEPTLGTIAQGELLYVADGQWDRFGPAGAVIDDAPLRPTAIRALPLRPAAAGQ